LKPVIQPPHRRAARALRFTILGLELALVLLSILSAYTLYQAFSASIQSGAEGIFGMEQGVDPETGDVLLTFKGQPRNTGFLPVTFGARARALTLANETVAEGEDSTVVPAGGSGAFTITLRLPRELVEQGRGAMEIEIHIRTLMDLTGFSIKLRIQSGG